MTSSRALRIEEIIRCLVFRGRAARILDMSQIGNTSGLDVREAAAFALGKNGSAGPNCTVLTINLDKFGSSLCMRFPIVTITLADVLPMAIVVAVVTITLADVSPVAIVVAVQSIHYNGVCPYPAHLFRDVLAKVGYVKNATSIVQVRIYQVSPEAVEYG